MAINGQTATQIKTLSTDVDTTEASFRTGLDHVIDEVDSLNTAPAPATESIKVIEQTGSGTFSVPAGITTLYISAVGGCGGAAVDNYYGGKDNCEGGSGATGAYVHKIKMTVTENSDIEYFVGAGGAGCTTPDNGYNNDCAGGAGQATTFGGISCGGGSGGTTYYTGGSSNGTGGTVVLSSGLDSDYGQDGKNGLPAAGFTTYTQNGLDILGSGTSLNKSSGKGYCGAYNNRGPHTSTGGSDGLIVVEW